MLREGSEMYDAIASPESIIPGPVPVLEPRTDDAPVVAPRPCGEATQIQTACTGQGENAAFTLQPNAMWGEHVGTPLSEETFTPAGVAVITTAEGLVEGKQEYGMILKGKNQVIALGYEGGMYLYASELAHGDPDRGGTGGEWVRLLAQANGTAMPSPAQANASWGKLQTITGRKLLVEQVVAGTQTLRELGYRPWAATLPSTRMPDMQHKELTTKNCARSIAEACNPQEGKSYFVSEKGDIVDVTHMRAKAGETLDAFTHMFCQYAAGVPQPTVAVRYGQGSQAEFKFSLSQDAVQPENLADTTFTLMQTESMLMEGIAQRYAVEHVPPPIHGLLPEFGGMGAGGPVL